MIWTKEEWALGVSYRGLDPQLDAALTAIALQHGGTQRRVGSGLLYRDLAFHFSNRSAANIARTQMLAVRPGVVAATALQPPADEDSGLTV